MAKFSSKTRSTLRRKLRKFAEASGGKIKWSGYCRPEEMGEFYRLSRHVSQKTYQERLLNAGLPDDDFFRDELARRANIGAVYGYILFFGDAPVSYLYLPIEGDRAIYAFLGYDPELSGLSPGLVLQLLALKDLSDEKRIKTFDFTQGGGQHKEMFGTYSVPSADLILLRRSARNLALIGAHSGWNKLEKRAGNILEMIGLKKMIKAALRR